METQVSLVIPFAILVAIIVIIAILKGWRKGWKWILFLLILGLIAYLRISGIILSKP